MKLNRVITSAHEVVHSHLAMMEALGHAIAKRDPKTGDHNYRVTWMAIALGEALGIGLHDMQRLIVGSFLHDIGKLGIPDSILLKPDTLNDEEMTVMRTHVMHGVDMVRGMGWLQIAYDVVAFHHEKWDGTGYPNGISGLTIPLVARIAAVADVFDALCSKRSYKQSLQLSEVLNTMQEQSGKQFDPDILVQFMAIAKQVHAQMESTQNWDVTLAVQAKVQHYFYTAEGLSPS